MPSPSAKKLHFAKIDKWPLEYFSHFEVKHVPHSTHTKHDDPAQILQTSSLDHQVYFPRTSTE